MKHGRLFPAHPRTRGFTLIELLIFIVVMGVLGVAIFASFTGALQSARELERTVRSAQLAAERMELILAQKRALGFAGFTAASFDPCTSAPPSTQPVCSAIPAGFTVTGTLGTAWNGDGNYKVITVTVSGKGGAQLTALVANY